MDSPRTGHVFVSHAQGDAPYATKLVTHLTSVNVPVWIDDELVTGDRWVSVIQSRLSECVALVVVMSPASAESVWVEREIRHVETLGKPILPVLLAGQPFFRLADMQYEDVTGGQLPSPRFVARLSALVDANAREGGNAGGAAGVKPPATGYLPGPEHRASGTPLLQVLGRDWALQALAVARALRVPLQRRGRRGLPDQVRARDSRAS